MGNLFSHNPLWSIGVVVTLAGFIAIHRLALYRDRKTVFNKAAKEFVDTFHSELKEVYPVSANWPDDIEQYLRARFDTLSEAVGKFERYLPNRQRNAFSKAWLRFYCWTDGGECKIGRDFQCYHHYKPLCGKVSANGEEIDYDYRKVYKENLRGNVRALLDFAP